MTVKTQGFYWHVHHGELIEWCYDYEGRVKYIQTDKPENEQEIRLRLFKPIKANLPNEVIEAWQAFVKTEQALDKANQAYNKAQQASDKEAINMPEQAFSEVWQAYVGAGQALDKALQTRRVAWLPYYKALWDNMSAIEELHAVECTNCPWDGDTIFPNTQQ